MEDWNELQQQKINRLKAENESLDNWTTWQSRAIMLMFLIIVILSIQSYCFWETKELYRISEEFYISKLKMLEAAPKLDFELKDLNKTVAVTGLKTGEKMLVKNK